MFLKYLIYSIIFFSLIVDSCIGQTIEWERACGGNNNDYFYSVATDSLGFIYIVGSTGSQNNGDLPSSCYPGSVTIDQDPWVYKCDSLGNLLWSKCIAIDGKIYDIVRSSHNTFYITGWLCDVQPGCDLWYAEMDTSGNLGAINFILGGPSENEYGYCVERSSTHDLIAVGMTNTALAHGDYDMYFLAADSNIALTKWYGGSNFDVGSYIHELSNGNLLVVGTTFSNDGDVTSNHGNGDAWVIEIDQLGNIIWQKTYGGSDWDNAYSFLQLPNGLICIVGNTASSDGDVSFNHSNTNEFDAWIFTIDSVGNIQSSWTFGGSHNESFNRIFFDSTTNSQIAIGTAASVDGDVFYNHDSLGGPEFWIVRIDSSGSIFSSSTLGGTGFETNYTSIEVGNDFIIVGSTDTDNNGDVSNYHFSAVYPDDGWVVRIKNLTTDIKPINSSAGIKLFPNPTHDKISISIPTVFQSQQIAIYINDLFGKIVLAKEGISFSEDIDISSLSSGCYIISVHLNNQSRLFKLIKL